MLPVTMPPVIDSVAALARPPPSLAELLPKVTLLSVAEPAAFCRPPPEPVARFPLTGQSVITSVPPLFCRPPPLVGAAVGDRQVLHRRGAACDVEDAALAAAADRQQIGPRSRDSGRRLSVRTSGPSVRVIVWGVVKRLVKTMASSDVRTLARLTAWRRLSWPGAEPTPSRTVLTGDDHLALEGADIDPVAPRLAALVGRRGAGRVPVPMAGLPGAAHGKGRAAVVAQRGQLRVAADQVVAAGEVPETSPPVLAATIVLVSVRRDVHERRRRPCRRCCP